MSSKLIQVKQEPRMLKDFLAENSQSCYGENINTIFSHKPLSKFFINIAAKYLQISSIKPPSILPIRSISRRLSNSRRNGHENVDLREISAKVKVKDILRWRSFRDLAEEESLPLDFASSPHHCTTVTTTTGSTRTSPSSRSSWCDSDFTAEDLPSWCTDSEDYAGETEGQKSRKILSAGVVAKDSMTVHPKGEWPCEENEQNSPVSVLDFSFQEDEESFSSFHQTPTHMELKKMQKNSLFMNENKILEEETNRLDEKPKQLLNHVEATSLVERKKHEDLLLLDFLKEELSKNRKQTGDDDAFDFELLRVAKAWLRGEDDEGYLEWKTVGKKEFSVRDMERGVKWNKFEEDEQELGLEMENELLNYLVDEVLVDFLFH